MFQSATLGKIESSVSILSVEEWINALVRGANNNGTYPIMEGVGFRELELTIDSTKMEAPIVIGWYSFGGSGEVPSSSGDSNKFGAGLLQGCKSIGGNK